MRRKVTWRVDGGHISLVWSQGAQFKVAVSEVPGDCTCEAPLHTSTGTYPSDRNCPVHGQQRRFIIQIDSDGEPTYVGPVFGR